MTNTSLTEKIGKLLAQAEGAGTEAEAAVFMAKAQELATHHSIDLAKARHAIESKHRTVPVMRRIDIGQRGTRGLNTLVSLMTNIGEAQGLRCTIAHNSTFVNFYGFDEDIDITEALFASLATQMVRACEEFKASGEWKSDTVWRGARYTNRYLDRYGNPCRKTDDWWDEEGDYTPGGYVPVTWLTARLNFQQSFASKVGQRLRTARYEAERAERTEDELRLSRRESAPHLDDEGNLTEHFAAWFIETHGLDLDGDDETAKEMAEAFRSILTENVGMWHVELVTQYSLTVVEPVSTGTELVLADKAREVQDFYSGATRHIRGSWKGGYSGRGKSATASSAGREAGGRASLSNSASLSGARKALS